MLKISTFTIILLFINITVHSQSIDQKVEDLLSRMTLEEKVGQMNQYNGFWKATGPVPEGGSDAKKKYDDLRAGKVGSMLSVRGVEDVFALQKIAVEETRLGIPLMFGFDVIHGYQTQSPIPLAEAASWDMEAIERSARLAAKEASAAGLTWAFAPMIDISRDARWGRVMEGGGEDPFLGSKIAAARVRGFQGKDLTDPSTIAACAKHFAGYGFAEAGKEYNTVDFGTSTLFNVSLPPFKAAVDAGVSSIMNAFNELNGVPATGDSWLQRDILKGDWGFEGVVLSDWASIRELVVHGYARDRAHAAEIAAKAGSDVDMESYAYVDHLVDLVKEGTVPIEVVEDAVRRVLKMKFKLGLFDDPYRYCSVEREQAVTGSNEIMEGVLEMAKKSIVLLKNEGNLLPLKKSGQKILLLGQLAESKNSPLGSWRLASIDHTAVSVLEGMQAYSDNELKYMQGPMAYKGQESFLQPIMVNESDKTGLEEAVTAAVDADVVVMVLGEHGFQSGEGRSITDLSLPGLQEEFLKAVYKANKNVILVLNNGRPLAIEWAAENIPAIVEAWQLGTQTGHAVASVLYGDYNPSGKLPMTFPRNVGQVPIYYNHKSTGRPFPQPIVFWSQYIDVPNSPLFPFGYGLSYTTFEYSELETKVSDDGVEVSINVTNTGSMEGEEIVQVYIRDKIASVTRPVKELKGFSKVSIRPGETVTLIFKLGRAELGFYNNQGKYVVESGAYDIMAGGNSRDVLSQEVSINWK